MIRDYLMNINAYEVSITFQTTQNMLLSKQHMLAHDANCLAMINQRNDGKWQVIDYHELAIYHWFGNDFREFTKNKEQCSVSSS